jgi:hypothetical protein
MENCLRMPNGRYLITGGKFLTFGAPPAPLTALAIQPFTVSHTMAHPVYPRRAGTDYGNLWISGTVTGTPAAGQIQVQVVDADSGKTIKPWAPLTSVSVAGGNFLGCLSVVPIGCNYNLQMRDSAQPNNAATTSVSTQRSGIGPHILLTGQSNMGTILSDLGTSYNDPVAGTGLTELTYWAAQTSGSSYWTTNGFVAPNAIGGTGAQGGGGNAPGMSSGGCLSPARIASMALSAKYGRTIPVCTVIWAVNSSGLQTFLLGSSNDAIFSGSGHAVATGGAMAGTFGFASGDQYGGGDFEIVAQFVGEANSGGSTTRATQKINHRAYYNQCLAEVAPYGRTSANLTYLPGILASNSDPNYQYVEDIRSAALEFVAENSAAWPNVRVGWNCVDCVPPASNSLHFTNQPDALKANRRMMQAIIHALVPELATYGGAGPTLTGAITRSGLTATFIVQHDGGTQLVAKTPGSPITGWYANTKADFSGTDIPVTVAINGTSKVDVTFPAGTDFAAGVWVKHCGARIGTALSAQPDTSNLIYDNAVYPYCRKSLTDATNIFANETYSLTGFPVMVTDNAKQVI